MVDQAAAGAVEHPRTKPASWPRARLGLVARIFVLIGLILAVDAGGEIYDGLARRTAAQAELRSRASSLAGIAALDVGRTFEAARHAMTVLANTQVIRDRDLEACSGLLLAVKRDLPMYDFISLDELDGRILCNDSVPAGRAAIRGDPWQISSAVASRDYVVGFHGHSKSTGNEVVRLSYPVLASDGTVDTVLVAGLNLKWLSASIAEWQLPAASVVDIADRNGTLLARYPSLAAVGRKLPEGLRAALDAAEAGVRLDTGLDGVARVYGYVPVSFGGARSILVAVGLDSEPALADIDRSVWRFILSASVFLLWVAVAAWVYIHRFIRRPIEALLHAAARWQAGDWTARAKSERGIAELEGLANAFDAMAESVAARENALRDSAASLQRSQQHLARAQRLAAVGSWESDPRTGRVEWSDEYYRILGVSRDTFQPTPGAFSRMVVEEDRPKLGASIALLRQSQSVPALEFRVVRADGAIRHLYREAEPLVDAAGKPIGFFGSVRDVTETRESELQLRRSREHLAHAQRVAGTGSFERDLRNGHIEWSDETYRIYGVSRDAGPLDLAGIEAMILPEDRERFTAALALGQLGYTGASPEFRIRRPDGTVRTIYREIEPVLDEAGNKTGVFGVIRDVTELRAAERQRDELERQLMHSQKLEALGTLAGGVAHDLNNTLVPIVALSKLALEELP
jgi:PAS domain S-box-containing protein